MNLKNVLSSVLVAVMFAIIISSALYFLAGQALKESILVSMCIGTLVYFLDLKPSTKKKPKTRTR